MTNNPAWIVIGLMIFAALLPSKWDPAIRLKEWNEKKRLEREKGK